MAVLGQSKDNIYISTPSNSVVNVVITPIGGTPQAVAITNASPYRYEIQGDPELGPLKNVVAANSIKRKSPC